MENKNNLKDLEYNSQDEMVYEVRRLNSPSNMTNWEVLQFCMENNITFNGKPLTIVSGSGVRRGTTNQCKAGLLGLVHRKENSTIEGVTTGQAADAYFCMNKDRPWSNGMADEVIKASKIKNQSNSDLKKHYGRMAISLLELPDYAWVRNDLDTMSKENLISLMKLSIGYDKAILDKDEILIEILEAKIKEQNEVFHMTRLTSEYKKTLFAKLTFYWDNALEYGEDEDFDTLRDFVYKFSKFADFIVKTDNIRKEHYTLST